MTQQIEHAGNSLHLILLQDKLFTQRGVTPTKTGIVLPLSFDRIFSVILLGVALSPLFDSKQSLDVFLIVREIGQDNRNRECELNLSVLDQIIFVVFL